MNVKNGAPRRRQPLVSTCHGSAKIGGESESADFTINCHSNGHDSVYHSTETHRTVPYTTQQR